MVRRPITALTALVLISASALAEVDFTPRESFYLAEATRIPNVAFRNGTKDVTYSPPGSWILSGGGKKLILTPPNTVQAEATMQTEPVKTPLAATDENLKAFGDRALALVPQEASKVVALDTGLASLKVCTHPLVQATFTYVLFAQHFTTTIYFLPLGKEQLTFQLTARSADFTALAKDFQRSLFSMQGL